MRLQDHVFLISLPKFSCRCRIETLVCNVFLSGRSNFPLGTALRSCAHARASERLRKEKIFLEKERDEI